VGRLMNIFLFGILLLAFTGQTSVGQKSPVTKKPKVYIDASDVPPKNPQLYGATTGTTPRKEIGKQWAKQCTETELTDQEDSADYTVQFADGRVVLFGRKKKMLFQSSSPLSLRSQMDERGVRDACNAIREREGFAVPRRPSEK
jgi:hypothetical protein